MLYKLSTGCLAKRYLGYRVHTHLHLVALGALFASKCTCLSRLRTFTSQGEMPAEARVMTRYSSKTAAQNMGGESDTRQTSPINLTGC